MSPIHPNTIPRTVNSTYSQWESTSSFISTFHSGLDLKWGQPEADESQPVRAYIVEVQEGRSGEWKKLAETKGTEFKVRYRLASAPFLLSSCLLRFR